MNRELRREAGPVGRLHSRRCRRGLVRAPGVPGLGGRRRTDRGARARPGAGGQPADLDGGRARAVLVHAGSANAATGPEGDGDSAALAARCGAAIGCPPGEVLLLGTGAVGVRLAVADAAEAADKAAAALGRRGSGEVAKAMTASGGVAREHAVAVAWSEGEVRIGGAAKASVPFAPAFSHPPD